MDLVWSGDESTVLQNQWYNMVHHTECRDLLVGNLLPIREFPYSNSDRKSLYPVVGFHGFSEKIAGCDLKICRHYFLQRSAQVTIHNHTVVSHSTLLNR